MARPAGPDALRREVDPLPRPAWDFSGSTSTATASGPTPSELARVATRLDRFLASAAAPLAADVSFEPELKTPALDRPEAELASSLTVMGGGQPALSFGALDSWSSGWQAANERWQAFLARVSQSLRYLAQVETGSGSDRLGWTVVSWSGAASTAWRSPVDPSQTARHFHNVDEALATRLALLSKLRLVVQGATKLAGVLTLPGGVILALPLVLRFVDRVLAESTSTDS